VLSGGVFQNLLLLSRTVALLEATGFRVLTHRLVPPNDGGLSLGQAVAAALISQSALRR
jgi:hydrogenase maturation protein HypF